MVCSTAVLLCTLIDPSEEFVVCARVCLEERYMIPRLFDAACCTSTPVPEVFSAGGTVPHRASHTVVALRTRSATLLCAQGLSIVQKKKELCPGTSDD